MGLARLVAPASVLLAMTRSRGRLPGLPQGSARGRPAVPEPEARRAGQEAELVLHQAIPRSQAAPRNPPRAHRVPQLPQVCCDQAGERQDTREHRSVERRGRPRACDRAPDAFHANAARPRSCSRGAAEPQSRSTREAAGILERRLSSIMQRYVISRRWTGWGDCIASLLSARRYARRTGRTLIIDWRGSCYMASSGRNAFSAFFEPLRMLEGVPVIGDDSVGSVNYPQPVYGNFGRDALRALHRWLAQRDMAPSVDHFVAANRSIYCSNNQSPPFATRIRGCRRKNDSDHDKWRSFQSIFANRPGRLAEP